MSSHRWIQQRLPNWLAWKINASLNSIFVFVWYLANTGANPAWWQMFNWCSHMTMLGDRRRRIKKKKTRGSEIKSIYFDHKWLIFLVQQKCNQLFCFNATMRHGLKGWKNKIQCTTTAICHKQESQTHQLSNIRHKTLFAKAITEQDQILCLMACIPAHARVAGWYSGGGK